MNAMYALVVSVALACMVLRVANGSPDFGIDATVGGIDKVLKWALVAKTNLLRVNDYVMPTQKSDIGKLSDAALILSDIGQVVNTLGPALIDAITTVTEDDYGDIESTYALLTFARVAFEEYTDNALQVQIQSIEALLGHHIQDQLVDDFFHIRARMDKLKDTLATLQTAAEDAVQAAGGGIVSDALLRQFIDEALVAQLARHLALLAHRVPVLIYTLTSSLENIQQADDYLYGLMEDTSRVMDAIAETQADFYAATMAYSAPVEAALSALVDDFEAGLASASDTAAALDNADLTAAIGALDTVRGTDLGDTLQQYTSLYAARVLELSELLPIESNFFFETHEHPAGVLVDVLIANGPWSRFCFWKYSAVLHNLLLVSNYAGECYDREYERLQTLQQALLVELDLIAYDLEIVDPYSLACTFLPAQVPDRIAECAQALGDYFLALSTAYDAKLTAFVRLVEIELKASEQRLSVCWSTRMQQSFLAFQNLVPDIVACSEFGPLA